MCVPLNHCRLESAQRRADPLFKTRAHRALGECIAPAHSARPPAIRKSPPCVFISIQHSHVLVSEEQQPAATCLLRATHRIRYERPAVIVFKRLFAIYANCPPPALPVQLRNCTSRTRDSVRRHSLHAECRVPRTRYEGGYASSACWWHSYYSVLDVLVRKERF